MPTDRRPRSSRFVALTAGLVGCVAVMLLGAQLMSAPASTGSGPPLRLSPAGADGWLPLDSFPRYRSLSSADHQRLFAQLDARWRDGYAPVLLELARFSDRPDLLVYLRERAGLPRQAEFDELWRWVWRLSPELPPDYADFKATLYQRIDPRFAAYFDERPDSTIRLDEIRWGGVRRDGIPPLKNPKMLAADQADYLDDSNVVFGIEINGEARAYPKRILAWHEMFKDTVGGVSVNGVYCTLCGMMILYETVHDGVHHELGTSGFLYRSNKLMYDHATESLWSTTRGVPVVGPLVGKGIRLKTRSVVTTTWGEWRRRHPETTVLSLETGHYRDYREGAAYNAYFSTDELMFTVPRLDAPPRPMANKAEVLALRFGAEGEAPLAISADFLSGEPVYHGEHGGKRYVVVTDASGANRVYDAGGRTFALAANDRDTLRDEQGGQWQVSEKALIRSDGIEAPRLPAHRAFWFGWQAAHPDTRLVSGRE